MKRRVAWAIGKDLLGAKNIEEALNMAELNFEVNKQKIYLNKGGMKVIPGQFANVRSDTGDVLGIVTDRYQIVQNIDAFNFVDGLAENGLVFEKGGAFREGRSIWVEGKLPTSYKVLGDDVDAHLVFVNAHDGKGSVRIAVIPNRLFCSNQLNFALKKAERSWAAKHYVTIEDRLKEAENTLGLADKYMKELSAEAEEMAVKKLTVDQFNDIIKKIYPIEEGDGARKVTMVNETRQGLMDCYNAPDIENFKGTAYGAALAVTDYFDHRDPQRATASFEEQRLEKIIGGYPDIDKLYAAIATA